MDPETAATQFSDNGVWNGSQYFAKHVALLVRDGLSLSATETPAALEGRLVLATVHGLGTKALRVGVYYAPHLYEQRCASFQLLAPFISQCDVLMGDFNDCPDVASDRVAIRQRVRPPPTAWDYIRPELLSHSDALRLAHPDGVFTRPQFVRGELISVSRIDHIWFKSTVGIQLKGVAVTATPLSDHRVVDLVAVVPTARERNRQRKTARNPRVWRMNLQLLGDPNFIALLESDWVFLQKQREEFQHVGEWWDWVKHQIRHTAQTFSRERAQQHRKQEQYLLAEKRVLDSQLNLGRTEEWQRLAEIESSLAELEDMRATGLAVRARRLGGTVAGDRSLATLHGIVKSSLPLIPQLRDHQGRLCKDMDEAIADRVALHYEDQNMAFANFDGVAANQLLESFEPVTATPAVRDALAKPIDEDDLKSVAQTLSKKVTSPGPDGLPYLLYVRCPFLIPALVEVCNAQQLPRSWSKANVRLLPKTGSLPDLGNWRPISLLNTDYKIYTRILTDRLQSIACLLPDSQTAFIRGRQLSSSALQLKCLLDAAREDPDHFQGWALLNLDQSKAYDRVSWQWLRMVLHCYHLPADFIDRVGALYGDWGTNTHSAPTSSYIVNSVLSRPVELRCGLRQGDPLSTLLYVFTLQPMHAEFTKRCQQLTYKTVSFHEVSHADDVVCALHRDDLDVYREVSQRYQDASGARINTAKSRAIPLMANDDNAWLDAIADCRAYDEVWTYGGFPMTLGGTLDSWWSNRIDAVIKQLERMPKTSVPARVTWINIFVLSKLWHVLSLCSPSDTLFTRLAAALKMAVLDDSRIYSWYWVIRPREAGGLGLLDPRAQTTALQGRVWQRYLQHLQSAPLSWDDYSDQQRHHWAAWMRQQQERVLGPGLAKVLFWTLQKSATKSQAQCPTFRALLKTLRQLPISFEHQNTKVTAMDVLSLPATRNPFVFGQTRALGLTSLGGSGSDGTVAEALRRIHSRTDAQRSAYLQRYPTALHQAMETLAPARSQRSLPNSALISIGGQKVDFYRPREARKEVLAKQRQLAEPSASASAYKALWQPWMDARAAYAYWRLLNGIHPFRAKLSHFHPDCPEHCEWCEMRDSKSHIYECPVVWQVAAQVLRRCDISKPASVSLVEFWKEKATVQQRVFFWFHIQRHRFYAFHPTTTCARIVVDYAASMQQLCDRQQRYNHICV